MKEIFKNLEGREWDWFGIHEESRKGWKVNREVVNKFSIIITFGIAIDYSLADLLANKSWCKAVWGESGYYTGDKFTGIKTMREAHERVEEFKDGLAYKCFKEQSLEAFQILQQKGEKECLTYIRKTMI